MYYFVVYLGTETGMRQQVYLDDLRDRHDGILFCGWYDESYVHVLKKLCGLVSDDTRALEKSIGLGPGDISIGNWYEGNGFFICEELASEEWHITVTHDNGERLRDLLLICESLVPVCDSYFELFKNGILILNA